MITAHFQHGDSLLTLYAPTVAHLIADLRPRCTTGRVVDIMRRGPVQ